MIYDDSREFCIFMTFDLSEDEVEQCRRIARERFEFEYEQDGLTGKLYIGNQAESSVAFEMTVSAIKNLLGDKIYAEEDTALEDCVVSAAAEYGFRIGIAESLTGGMLCARLVNVSGCSKVLQEGFVTYTDAAKVRQLHVKTSTLERFGAVSAQTAEEMVAGLLAIDRDLHLAIATTGCAGPESDDYDTPVGLVYVGIGGSKGIKTFELFYDGPRNYVRKCTTDFTLYQVLQYIKKYARKIRG